MAQAEDRGLRIIGLDDWDDYAKILIFKNKLLTGGRTTLSILNQMKSRKIEGFFNLKQPIWG
jgi:hypothetical protein